MPLAPTRRTRAPWLAAFIAAAGMALAHAPAGAIVDAPAPRGTVSLPATAAPGLAIGARQRALESSPAWRDFRDRHGDWRAVWNAATGSPHRAVGPSIPLAGFANDSATVDRAIGAFVAANPGLFGAGTVIEPRSVRRHGAMWYASYRQLVDGLEVLFADWEFRVSANGRLVLIGADAYRFTAHAPRSAAIAPAAARLAATTGVDFMPGRDMTEPAGDLALLPIMTSAGPAARLVMPVRVRTTSPLATWLTLVDATNGEVVMRVNQARNIAGRVTGLVHPELPTDPRTPLPFANEYVFVDADSTVTDATGAYALPSTGIVTVRAELRGPYIDVDRADVIPSGSDDAHYSITADSVDPTDIPWGDVGFSHDAERDAFLNANRAHDHAKALDPGLTGLDYSMPIVVNFPFGYCNAQWTGSSIYLFTAGNGCVNTATTPTVVIHEYGHAVNDFVYQGDGLPFGMQNPSLHEGTADLYAAFLRDDPTIGAGFFGFGSYVRTADNTLRWPEDHVTDPHANGEILLGAFWSLRQIAGLTIAERLSHQAKHGHPDDVHDDVAFIEMFLETLVADDDDGDLANGTPHAADIAHAFSAHGLGPNFWITFDHAAVADPIAGGLVPVSASIRYDGPGITALDVRSPTLHYAVNGGAFTAVPLAATGAADQFAASIPAPAGSIVSYYLTASDGFGDEATFPIAAPARRVLRFVVGPATPMSTWDMETDPGWTVGAPDDDATDGIWVRTDPVGTWSYDTANVVLIQPGDDHTPNGTQCWVTGNVDTLFDPGFRDVDGGKTTLTTASFDGAPVGYEHPVIEYWRWYSNNTGSFIAGDVWRVDISGDDGATWSPVESTRLTFNSWERELVDIGSILTPTHTMRVRFVANDDSLVSRVEAAVDDFRLLAFPAGTLSAGAERAAARLELSAPRPNPSLGPATLRLSLPAATHVRLALFDVTGRLVRTLVDGALGAGDHPLVWDGLDDLGHGVAGGLYFARLDAAGERRVQRVVRVR